MVSEQVLDASAKASIQHAATKVTEMDYFIVRVLFLAVRGELNSWREDLGAKAFGFCLLKLERNYLWQNQRQRPYFFAKNVVTKHPNGWDSVPVVISGIR